MDVWQKHVYRGSKVLAISLDIRGAFDHILYDSAERVMQHHNFDPKIIKWYLRFLRSRVCTYQVKGVTRRQLLRRGVPQGRILSPLLWNLVFDELVLAMNTRVRMNAYADDGLLM